MRIFALIILMLFPDPTPYVYCCTSVNKQDWAIWTPSGLVCETEHNVRLQPEFNYYPIGVAAIRFTLNNEISNNGRTLTPDESVGGEHIT
ncbi:MAG: hypothetical protein FWC78_07580 [Defluviitaleaceae bacterium]|nr:hypothetical protein [Defluviitaleaceae bacterium]